MKTLSKLKAKRATLFVLVGMSFMPTLLAAQVNAGCAEVYELDLAASLYMEKISSTYEPRLDSLRRDALSTSLRAYGGTTTFASGSDAAKQAAAPIRAEIDRLEAARDAKIGEVKYRQESLRYENAECFE